MLLHELSRLLAWQVGLAFLACCIVGYVLYQLFLHPLARYPGPFLCKLTDFKKLHYFATMHVDTEVLRLHQRYGPIVRIAPNELSFWGAGAVGPIYKSGRSMTKAPFFNGFTALKPNLFGTRDEELHALRRRQMAHSFSTTSLTKMEAIFDRHILVLREKLDEYAARGENFDLKDTLSFYAYDVLGQLAFSTNFETQKHSNPQELPPIDDHIWLSTLFGSVPAYLPWSMSIAKYVPNRWLQGLIASRNRMRQDVLRHVQYAMSKSEKDELHHTTLLSHLIAASDPETGEKLTPVDIASEAFGFLIAGSHTTAASLTLLFYHILHNPDILRKVEEEMVQELPSLQEGAFSYTGLEKKLPYMTACIREGFRMSPVFTMPLTRMVAPEEGMEIDGQHLPKGTNCSISNYSLHHNPEIWGEDAAVFKPERWLDSEYTKENLNYLMHFGMGHRSCIGRNIAMINICKVLTLILRCYRIEAVKKQETLRIVAVGIGEKEGPLWCKIAKRD